LQPSAPAMAAEQRLCAPYEFYCGAWMGGSNPHMDFQVLKGLSDGAGEASMSLRLQPGDVDTFKVGVYVRDASAKVMRHVASGFNTLSWLRDGLAGADSCDSAKQSLLLKDNYTPNQALLHFCSDSSDVPGLEALLPSLTPSALHRNDWLNSKVVALSYGLHDLIEELCNVSNLNGGASFVNSMCFTEAMGCAINYPLLDLTYSSKRHRAPLAMLAYAGLSTLHNVGVPPESLLKLGDYDFVTRFVVPLCTSFTLCPKAAVYSGDETLGPEAKLNFGTEDFAMVLSKHLYTNVRTAYTDRVGAKALQAMDIETLRRRVAELCGRKDLGDAEVFSTIVDDCETLSGLIKSHEGAIHQFHLASVAACGLGSAGKPVDPAVLEEAQSAELAKMMWEQTRALENLAAVPFQDFLSLARLLSRYGRLRENHAQGKTPSAQMGLCIVSAKGPSFSFANRELNGHACVVAMCVGADGTNSFSIAEGTSNLTMRDLPSGCPPSVTLMLTDGPKQFDTMDALGVLSLNMADYLKTTGKTRVAECIRQSFGCKDPYDSCPFYMASFFAGLQMDKFTPSIVPIELRMVQPVVPVLKESGITSVSAASEGSLQCVFGAPVVGMSNPKVKSMPVDLGAAFGEQVASEFLSVLEARGAETYPPKVDDSVVLKLMSRWCDVQPLASGKYDPEHCWICTSSEAFEDADLLRAMLEYKSRVAAKFNSIQAEDPASDGATMAVKGHMLSVVCHLYVPLPKEGTWNLSCIRNIKAAMESLPLAAKQGGEGKAAHVGGEYGSDFGREFGTILGCKFSNLASG